MGGAGAGGAFPTARRIAVAGERIERWVAGFLERHAPVTVTAVPELVELAGADGATARVEVPFPPLRPAADPLVPERVGAELAAHALAPRVVGVLLVRRGGFAAGVFDGGALVASRVGTRHVQGRTAAGGWSQQRFARRREGQARVARDAAADAAAAVLVPEVARLDAVVLGGDRRSCDLVMEDLRLAPLRTLVAPLRLDVPEPRRAVLDGCGAALRTLRIIVSDPARPAK